MLLATRHRLFSLLFPAFLLVTGCKQSPQVDSVREYYRYIADPDHGLVKSRRVNGMIMTVRHLPPEYQVYRQVQGDKTFSPVLIDSLLQLERQSMGFLLTLGPDDRVPGEPDIMFAGIRDYEEYTQRVLSLSFRMEERLALRCGGRELEPVLSTLENLYGIRASRSVMCVFVPNAADVELFRRSDRFDFVYDDEQFGLGINHFVFRKSDLDRIPSMPWEKI